MSDNVVTFGRRQPPPPPPPQQRRQPTVRPMAFAVMPGRIASMVKEELSPPDALGDQYMPLAYLVVRDRAEVFMPGAAEPRARTADNED